MNPGEEELKAKSIRAEDMERVMRDLELERFIEKPVSMLSNGQSRRARIAKALLSEPEMLCLDAPFSKFSCLVEFVRESANERMKLVWIQLSRSIFLRFYIA